MEMASAKQVMTKIDFKFITFKLGTSLSLLLSCYTFPSLLYTPWSKLPRGQGMGILKEVREGCRGDPASSDPVEVDCGMYYLGEASVLNQLNFALQ